MNVEEEITRIISAAQRRAGHPKWVRWLVLTAIANLAVGLVLLMFGVVLTAQALGFF